MRNKADKTKAMLKRPHPANHSYMNQRDRYSSSNPDTKYFNLPKNIEVILKTIQEKTHKIFDEYKIISTLLENKEKLPLEIKSIIDGIQTALNSYAGQPNTKSVKRQIRNDINSILVELDIEDIILEEKNLETWDEEKGFKTVDNSEEDKNIIPTEQLEGINNIRITSANIKNLGIVKALIMEEAKKTEVIYDPFNFNKQKGIHFSIALENIEFKDDMPEQINGLINWDSVKNDLVDFLNKSLKTGELEKYFEEICELTDKNGVLFLEISKDKHHDFVVEHGFLDCGDD